MKFFFKSIFFLTLIFFHSFNAISAEKSHELLKPGWSFKGFFGNLIEPHCKGDIKFILKFVRLVIQ